MNARNAGRYSVYEDGVKIASGSSKEIAKLLGMNYVYVSRKASIGGLYRDRYKIVKEGKVKVPCKFPKKRGHYIKSDGEEGVKNKIRESVVKLRRFTHRYKCGDRVILRGHYGEVIYADDKIFTISYEIPSGHLRESFQWYDLSERDRGREYDWMFGRFNGIRIVDERQVKEWKL